jgi:ketosteroid isomerase-like protein
MSEENVEIVRKGFEAWNRGDFGAFFDRFADEYGVLRAAEGWRERFYYGKDAVRSFYDGYAEKVGGELSVVGDPVDAGDAVIARVRAHPAGEHSRVKADMEFSQVFTFRKGKIVMHEYFWDHQEALEAAGLSE